MGLIGPMSKADAADSDSTVRKHRQRGLIPWKPGQSGNPKGRPKGSRNKLSEEFFRDLCDAWQAFGKPALETMAMLYPVEFVRLVASLIPKEPEATPQLWSACLTRSSMPLSRDVLKKVVLILLATDEDAQIIQ